MLDQLPKILTGDYYKIGLHALNPAEEEHKLVNCNNYLILEYVFWVLIINHVKEALFKQESAIPEPVYL